MQGPPQTLTLTDFLLARLEEDVVKRVTMREWHTIDCDTIPDSAGYTYPCDCGVPERMAREVEAKRRIIADPLVHDFLTGKGISTAGRRLLLHLASVYADHPDHREEWRP